MTRLLRFSLDGRIPSKKNSKSIFQNKRTGKPFITSSKDFKKWHEAQCLQLNLQKHQYELPIKKCESIEVRLYYGDLRKSDNTNKYKCSAILNT